MEHWLLPFVVKAQVFAATRPAKSHKGQGVIEYAGALVVASLITAAVIKTGPETMSTVFKSILTSVQSYFQSNLPK